jgi:hypothetical protein
MNTNLDDSCESVGEDAELQLSCALQHLAVKCKSVTAKITDDIPEKGDEEITEELDIPDAKQKRQRHRSLGKDDDWNYNQTQKELSAMQSNIQNLLERLAAEAKKSDHDHCKFGEEKKPQAKGSSNQVQEK